MLPLVVVISPEMLPEQDVIQGSKSSKQKVVGVENA